MDEHFTLLVLHGLGFHLPLSFINIYLPSVWSWTDLMESIQQCFYSPDISKLFGQNESEFWCSTLPNIVFTSTWFYSCAIYLCDILVISCSNTNCHKLKGRSRDLPLVFCEHWLEALLVYPVGLSMVQLLIWQLLPFEKMN